MMVNAVHKPTKPPPTMTMSAVCVPCRAGEGCKEGSAHCSQKLRFNGATAGNFIGVLVRCTVWPTVIEVMVISRAFVFMPSKLSPEL
ncbi:hypothetical protein D3C85_1678180 [compost metagenome]